MPVNGARSGSKKMKSGAITVDFRMVLEWRHGGERGLVKILFTIPYCSLLFPTIVSTIPHCVLPQFPDCSPPCPTVSLLYRFSTVEIGDPYSGAFAYTVLYGKIPRPLQRGIYYCVLKSNNCCVGFVVVSFSSLSGRVYLLLISSNESTS